MLQLQQLALRNDLQIIVTSHSPVVLNSVPVDGRIFLERTEDGRVVLIPPHRDIILIWERLQQAPERWANGLGCDPESLASKTGRLDAIYDSAGDSPANIAKSKLHDLAEAQNRPAAQVCRLIAHSEAGRGACFDDYMASH